MTLAASHKNANAGGAEDEKEFFYVVKNVCLGRKSVERGNARLSSHEQLI